jgi:hypothetical protein
LAIERRWVYFSPPISLLPIRICDLISAIGPKHIAIEILGEAPVPYLSSTFCLVDKMGLPTGAQYGMRSSRLSESVVAVGDVVKTTLHIAAGQRLGMRATFPLHGLHDLGLALDFLLLTMSRSFEICYFVV